MSDPLIELLVKGLEEKVYPGAVLLVAREEEVLFLHNLGQRTLIPNALPMEKETVFDLASLTKPLSTALAIMKLVDQGVVDLDAPLSSIITPFPWNDKNDLTVRLLLTHTSGLPAWRPYYRQLTTYSLKERKPAVRRLIMEEPLCEKPKGVSRYSDLGFMLLEWVIEIATGQDLSSYLRSTFYAPLSVKTMHLDEITCERPRKKEFCAATEYCAWRREVMQGHVHDENAYALGGYSGHAGLFGTAGDIFTLTAVLVKIYKGCASGLLKTETVRAFFERQEIVSGATWALGWDTPSDENSSSGSYFSRRSVGHTGFTGTSLWIDLEKGVTVIFLSNRIHPCRSNEKIRQFRPQLHNLIMHEFAYA
jgi:CubicO group peptidase (beta-lactamase class C family)